MLVRTPDLDALACQDVQHLRVGMAKGIIGPCRNNPKPRLYLLHKSQ